MSCFPVLDHHKGSLIFCFSVCSLRRLCSFHLQFGGLITASSQETIDLVLVVIQMCDLQCKTVIDNQLTRLFICTVNVKLLVEIVIQVITPSIVSIERFK